MKSALRKLWKEESGQGLAEYGLILGLVAIAVIGVLGLMGGSLENIFTDVQTELDEAVPSP